MLTLSYIWTPGKRVLQLLHFHVYQSRSSMHGEERHSQVLWISDKRISLILCSVASGKPCERKDVLHYFILLYLCVCFLHVWLWIQFLGNWLSVKLKSSAEISLRIQRWARSSAELCSQIPEYRFLLKLSCGPAICNFCKHLPDQ